MEFSYDSSKLFAASAEPEWTMYVYRTDKGKVENTAKGNNLNGTGTVNQIACNPNDFNVVALVGSVVFKILACSDNVWRQFGYSKADSLNLTAVTWLAQERLMAATADGKFMIFESGELKMIAWAGDLPVLSLKAAEKEELHESSQTNLSEPSAGSIQMGEDYRIHCLISFPRGFAFAYLNGTVHFYEKEAPHRYKKRNIYKVPDRNIIRKESDAEFVMNEITSLGINTSQERLVLTCKQNQLYTVKLWGVDLFTNPEVTFTEYGQALHHGTIGGLDVCAWKPIFITSGEWDRTLRVWNYETDSIELIKQFQEDIRGVALHPTGLYAVVGFSDKLRFLTIMIDDFVTTREFPIRNCRSCTFSNMGHYFAATNGNLIQVYSTTTFENVFNLKGHNGKLLSMSWVHNDYKMTSCGNEGAVYDWDIITQKRVAETIVKSCAFSGVAVTSDGKFSYSIGSDGHIRQITNANIYREVLVTKDGLDSIVLSNSNQMLFVSGNEGTIYSVQLPILDTAEYVEFGGHCATVQRMRISYDDRFLISASSDGVIAVWKLMHTEGKTLKVDKDFIPSTDILITRVDLEEKIELIRTLQLRMHELMTEHSYQMRNVEALNNTKMREVHEKYCMALEDLKDKNEQLESEHAQEISNMTVETSNLKLAHEQFIQKLDVSYNDKLIVEYHKYMSLEEKMGAMRTKYEKELDVLRDAKKTSEESIKNDFLQKLHEKEVHVEELIEETNAKTREHELIKQQIEDDADREIYELKTSHEKLLKEEQDNNVKLKGETGILRKKLLAGQKEIDELKYSVYSLQCEQAKFKTAIVGLEKDIADLKKEISERDTTIQDKEKRIYELKRKNQELEKFKFILDFKIKELKSQIEPRDKQIREQTEQINDMVNELENLQKIIVNLDIQLGELREKLSAADHELKREIVKNRASKAALKTIRTDLHHVSGIIQEPAKLAKALKEMYHKYNADKDFDVIRVEEGEARNEFHRQRDFLERTVKTLQQQVITFSKAGGGDKIRLVEENATLIAETNKLRRNLKTESTEKKKMQSLLGLTAKYMPARQAQKRLNEAVMTSKDIQESFKQKLDDDQNTIGALKNENARLLDKIMEEREQK
ncbi:cilia- and flagella-associated protein 57 [Photinus pyralis]|nr:cilia- and flagella-associated protein 57 [Photinus pyralis]